MRCDWVFSAAVGSVVCDTVDVNVSFTHMGASAWLGLTSTSRQAPQHCCSQRGWVRESNGLVHVFAATKNLSKKYRMKR